jgi:hypothetical protein
MERKITKENGEALQKVLEFVMLEETKHEADASVAGAQKDWEKMNVETQKAACFAEIHGFIDQMIADAEKESSKMEEEEVLKRILEFVTEEEEKNADEVYTYTQSKNWNATMIALAKMGCFSLARVFVQNILEDLTIERD